LPLYRSRRGHAGAVTLKRLGLGTIGIALALALGAFIGAGAFTFHYGEGWSYFSTDPSVCINCHVMRPQYDSWHKASHRNVAGCVDCHLPHDFPHNIISKADNGWNHSWAFTFQNFHEPIQIKPRNARILQDNCIRCHSGMVHELMVYHEPIGRDDRLWCVHCHLDVGHGPMR
jgi:cytochrome c nitrite reductase small subunit